MPTIPSYPTPTLERDEVLSYFARILEQGWPVYAGSNPDQFIVRIEDNLKLFVEKLQGKWRVSTGLAPSLSIAIWAYPETLDELRSAADHAIATVTCGRITTFENTQRPTQARLRVEQPASNLARVASLLSEHTVLAVFDAYLDNKGLDALLNLTTLGVKVSATLRLLTASKMFGSGNGQSRLTESYFRTWQTQLSLNSCELRHKPYGGHQRRFLLLDKDRILIVGPSLNNLAVNEAIQLTESQEDFNFFEAEWITAAAM